ncbi:MAG: AAA family ATPase [Actinomycetota bacterium]|nr:AAA family ATPase [Actinomycetota bacterium]
MTKNLVLLGMMGTGKSTVAVVLAERLGRPLVDTDVEVERMVGRRIRTIFAEEGEPAFRRLERLAVANVARHSQRVVSVGGGAVVDDANVIALRSSGVLVELRAPVETLTARLATESRSDDRPLLAGPDPTARIAELIRVRAPRYAAVSDFSLDAVATPAEIAEDVLAWAASIPGVLSHDELRRAATPARAEGPGGWAPG